MPTAIRRSPAATSHDPRRDALVQCVERDAGDGRGAVLLGHSFAGGPELLEDVRAHCAADAPRCEARTSLVDIGGLSARAGSFTRNKRGVCNRLWARVYARGAALLAALPYASFFAAGGG